ncbi:hypothetical protein UFOVP422_39 [uncultured Caudovirales phage]|uniref:Uncharacterized protein n=1 Tax=uncultured Caudovirales phage TaxID=2100421 RepID=A0A6J5M6W9_9CAUD|nr:hypothetical protein UFOVP422_39 [uncultured Caudovirales phage]
MNIDDNKELSAMYDNVPDWLLFGMLGRCCLQLQQRKYLSVDEAIALFDILSRAIDNAVDANEALNEVKNILRGDV